MAVAPDAVALVAAVGAGAGVAESVEGAPGADAIAGAAEQVDTVAPQTHFHAAPPTPAVLAADFAAADVAASDPAAAATPDDANDPL